MGVIAADHPAWTAAEEPSQAILSSAYLRPRQWWPLAAELPPEYFPPRGPRECRIVFERTAPHFISAATLQGLAAEGVPQPAEFLAGCVGGLWRESPWAQRPREAAAELRRIMEAARVDEQWAGLAASRPRDGQRKRALARMAGHLLSCGVHIRAALTLCESWNAARFEPPLDREDVFRTLEWVARRDLEDGAT